MAQSYIWGDNLRALCVYIDIFMEMRVGWKQNQIYSGIFPPLLHSAIKHGNHSPLQGLYFFHAGRLVK